MTELQGTQLAAGIVTFTDGDSYCTHYSQYGKGGWREVASTTDRDAITTDRRTAGMAVYVTGEDKLYILNDDLTTWTEFAGGGGGGANVVNEYSTSTTDAYSANYSNQKFAPMSYMTSLYMTKVTDTTATFSNTKPTVADTNYLSLTTTNTSFDWTTSNKLVITRTLEAPITFNPDNSVTVHLGISVSRDATLEFGGRVLVNNTAVTTNQSFGNIELLSANPVTNTQFVIRIDNITAPIQYNKGDVLTVEIFTKQLVATSLTTTFFCGKTVDSADRYSYMNVNFESTALDSGNIKDNAVTYQKLSTSLQASIDKAEGSEQVANKTSSYNSESTITYPNSKALTDGLATKLGASNIVAGDNIVVDTSNNNVTISVGDVISEIQEDITEINTELADKLETTNLIAGSNITLNTSGNNVTISSTGGGTTSILYPFVVNEGTTPESDLLCYYNAPYTYTLPAMTQPTVGNCTISVVWDGYSRMDTYFYKVFGQSYNGYYTGPRANQVTGDVSTMTVTLNFTKPLPAGTYNFSYYRGYINNRPASCTISIICYFVDGTSQVISQESPTLSSGTEIYTSSATVEKAVKYINFIGTITANYSGGDLAVRSVNMSQSMSSENSVIMLNASQAVPMKATLANSSQMTVTSGSQLVISEIEDGTYNIFSNASGVISLVEGTVVYGLVQPEYIEGLIWVNFNTSPVEVRQYSSESTYTLITDRTFIGNCTISDNIITNVSVNPYINYNINPVKEELFQKIINSDNNYISNIKVADMQSNAVATSISDTPVDTKLSTEKAVADCTNAIEEEIQEIATELPDKLEVSNIIAGNNISLSTSGNNITISSTGDTSAYYPFCVHEAVDKSQLIEYVLPTYTQTVPTMTAYTSSAGTVTTHGNVYTSTTQGGTVYYPYNAFGQDTNEAYYILRADSGTFGGTFTYTTPLKAGDILFTFRIRQQTTGKITGASATFTYTDDTTETVWTSGTMSSDLIQYASISKTTTKALKSFTISVTCTSYASINNIYLQFKDNKNIYVNATSTNPLVATTGDSTKFTLTSTTGAVYTPTVEFTGSTLIYVDTDGNVSTYEGGYVVYSKTKPTYSSGLVWEDLSSIPFSAKAYSDETTYTEVTGKTCVGQLNVTDGTVTSVTTFDYHNARIDIGAKVFYDKTINVSDGNVITGLTTTNMNSSAIATSISDTPVDTKLTTEKAVHDYVENLPKVTTLTKFAINDGKVDATTGKEVVLKATTIPSWSTYDLSNITQANGFTCTHNFTDGIYNGGIYEVFQGQWINCKDMTTAARTISMKIPDNKTFRFKTYTMSGGTANYCPNNWNLTIDGVVVDTQTGKATSNLSPYTATLADYVTIPPGGTLSVNITEWKQIGSGTYNCIFTHFYLEELVTTNAVGFDVDATDPLSYTNTDNETTEVTSISSIAVSSLSDGTYNIYLTTSGTAYTLQNTIYSQMNEPDDPSVNDIWVTNTEPLKALKYTSDDEWVDFADVPCGSFIIVSGAISELIQPSFNQNGYDVNIYTDIGGSLSSLNAGAGIKITHESSSEATVSADPIKVTSAEYKALVESSQLIVGQPYYITDDNDYLSSKAFTTTTAGFANLTNTGALIEGQAYYITDDNVVTDVGTSSSSLTKFAINKGYSELLVNNSTSLGFNVNANASLTYTNASGSSTTTTSLDNISVSSTSDGTYKVALPASGSQPYLFGGSISISEDTPINATKVGSPTISNGVVSGFSSGNYLALKRVFNPQNSNWELVFCFTLTNASADQRYFTNADHTLHLGITSNTLKTWIGTGGSSWDISNGLASTTTLVNNTKYYVKIAFTGTQYTVSLSTDGQNWNVENTITSSSVIGSSTTSWLGSNMNTGCFLQGSIDLKESYIKIDDQLWWSYQGGSSMTGDVWLNPQEPYEAKQYNGTSWEVFDDTILLDSSVTVSSNAITSITQPTYNYNKIDLNTISKNNRRTISDYGAVSSRYVDLTIGATDTWYTMPANGWLHASGTANVSSWAFLYFEGANNCAVQSTVEEYGSGQNIIMPVFRGESVLFGYRNINVGRLRFFYAQGEY